MRTRGSKRGNRRVRKRRRRREPRGWTAREGVWRHGRAGDCTCGKRPLGFVITSARLRRERPLVRAAFSTEPGTRNFTTCPRAGGGRERAGDGKAQKQRTGRSRARGARRRGGSWLVRSGVTSLAKGSISIRSPSVTGPAGIIFWESEPLWTRRAGGSGRVSEARGRRQQAAGCSLQRALDDPGRLRVDQRHVGGGGVTEGVGDEGALGA